MNDDTSITVEVADPARWLAPDPYLYMVRASGTPEALVLAVTRDATLSVGAVGVANVVASYIADEYHQITVAMIGDRCTDAPDVILVYLRELADHGYVTLLAGAG